MPFLNETLVANGVSALGRIVYSKAILDIITNDHVIDLAVNAGGTGYVVGETFDVVGGTSIGAFVARGIVTAEAAGVVTGVKIISAGAYSTLPGVTGAATTNASAAGNDDLTVDLTTQTALWTQDRSDYTDDTTDFEWICTSTKSSNAPTIGMITETSSGNDAVRVMTASSYNSLATFDGQPDISPSTVSYLNVPAQNPEVYLSITERRVNFVARDGNNVQYGGLGLFIPVTNNDASYPFPGVAHAQTRSIQAMSSQYSDNGNGSGNAGIVNPPQHISTQGPYYYRDNLSAAWKGIADEAVSGRSEAMMWPHNQNDAEYDFTHAPEINSQGTNPFSSGRDENGIFSDDTVGWFEDANGSAIGIQGIAPFGTGEQMSFVVTAHIIESGEGIAAVVGYVDGFEAVHGVGLTAFEEIESYQSASRYIVFPDTNGSDLGQWVAMEIV